MRKGAQAVRRTAALRCNRGRRGAGCLCLAMIACTAVVAQIAPAQASASEATFGKTCVGNASDYFLSERKRVNRYALPEAAP